MKVSVTKNTIQSLKLDAVAFPISKSEKDNALKEVAAKTGVTVALFEKDFSADESSLMMLYPDLELCAFKRVFLVGLGDKPGLDACRSAMASLAKKVKELKLATVGVDLSGAKALSETANDSVDYIAQTAVEGFHSGLYDFNQLKTNRVKELKSGKSEDDEPKQAVEELVLATDAKILSDVKKGAETGDIIATSQAMVRDLVNSPSNYMTALDFAERVKASGEKHGFKVTVFDKAKIEELKMGGLLGVNKGSVIPPTFSIMEYKPEGESLGRVALVGKGVMFDTGGISIKPSSGMGDMKADMAGGADVLGAVEAAARLKLPLEVIGIVPATDNMPSGSAQNPGDVLTTYSGITVEVDNTDAEGRLILADALTYVKETYNPDTIIDLATLTGACIVALGETTAGLFSNNDELAEKLYKAGQRAGEKVWRMPIWDEYDKLIKSNVADVKNVGGRSAGSITAAKFLEKFVGDHSSWAHLDIAGPAFPGMTNGGGSGSTGFGVRLLVELMRNWK
ncbi:Leucyl aminopeptidase [Chloroherpeton thalassium ATCC 35110]|uniref:Probable cytosol aminopeptidase n=1 Tax=Chloroherpeton thalassium (strain ATCC 35110 / GB-78) TaxID=517418 RepID=AMPA_CHLT3|nr:leucyl aminopeptidase [Chloroherpeton thalassium]B3QVE8.1 RecName: Full=Probable cytosol aminopeptidase; AltName: Full=Leucine aminopeptidase; Short=LAP; AltName: Full=Leucyl aminopeptidase [Chloroherpeton thalassium ATCC 35110]ACF14548.1 Leucyl aminopeptidase [Chloroherpeton thalassium ATCC 35110]